MTHYTAHIPPGARLNPGADTEPSDDTILVADGFHLFAMIAPPFWLLRYGQWLGLVVFLVILALLLFLSEFIAPWALFVVATLMALFFGMEASSLRRWRLQRAGWQLVDAFVARGRIDAELRFLERWKAGRLTSISALDKNSSIRHDTQGPAQGAAKAGRPPSVIGYSRDPS